MGRQPVNADEVTVQSEGRTLTVDRALGEVNLDDLVRECSHVGGDAMWFGAIGAAAEGVAKRHKLTVGTIKAEVAKRIRRDRATLGEKVTEAVIFELVTLDLDVRAAEEQQIELETRAEILKRAYFTLQEKQKMLTGLSSAAINQHPHAASNLRDAINSRTDEMKSGRRAR